MSIYNDNMMMGALHSIELPRNQIYNIDYSDLDIDGKGTRWNCKDDKTKYLFFHTARMNCMINEAIRSGFSKLNLVYLILLENERNLECDLSIELENSKFVKLAQSPIIPHGIRVMVYFANYILEEYYSFVECSCFEVSVPSLQTEINVNTRNLDYLKFRIEGSSLKIKFDASYSMIINLNDKVFKDFKDFLLHAERCATGRKINYEKSNFIRLSLSSDPPSFIKVLHKIYAKL